MEQIGKEEATERISRTLQHFCHTQSLLKQRTGKRLRDKDESHYGHTEFEVFQDIRVEVFYEKLNLKKKKKKQR